VHRVQTQRPRPPGPPVRVLADGYDLPATDRPDLIPAVLSRLLRNVDFWTQRPCPEAAERIAWSHREHAFTTANRDIFEAALA
jgi:hypothetical protein